MSQPRQPIYLQLDEYSKDSKYIEKSKSIYITSSRYKVEWWYQMVRRVIKACYEEPSIAYNFFMVDIYTAIKYGLKSIQDWIKIKQNSSQIDIDAEYLNIPLGEAEDAFFTLELFKSCQKNKKAFIPPTYHFSNIKSNMLENKKKTKDEIRLLVCDFAFSNTTSTGWESDNTVLLCMSATPHQYGFDRNVDYIETVGGGNSDETLRRIRELYWDYECDWIIIDGRSGGETIYNELTKFWEHPSRNNWNGHGFSVCRDMRLHDATNAKVKDLISRTVDPDAIQCVIPVYATDTSNDLMWQALLRQLTRGNIGLLIDSLFFEEMLEEKQYFHATNEERTNIKMPYVQTELLINEAVNLKRVTGGRGTIKLVEPKNGHKDRVICLAYGNAFVDKLENVIQYKSERSEEFDESDWEGIFCV